MKFKKNKVISILLLTIILFNSVNINSYANREDKLISNISEKEEIDIIKDKANKYFEEYWMNTKEVNFENLYKEYLFPENIVFNKEMEVRTEYYNQQVKNMEEKNRKIISDKLNLEDELNISKLNDSYILSGMISRSCKDLMDDGTILEDPGILVKVEIEFKKIDNKFYITNFQDGLSRFNNKNKPVLYTSNEVSEVIEVEKELENIENIRTEYKKTLENIKNNDIKQNLNIKNKSMYSNNNFKDFDRTKARDYARKWAVTSPYCNTSRYSYIPASSGGDCANFASQVLHEAGVPFTSDILKNQYNKNEWFALKNGTKKTQSWAYASGLKEFIIQNTKVYNRKGPVYWRSAWFDRGQDNTLYPGDLIFLCDAAGPNNGKARHTLICTTTGSKNTAKISAHTQNQKDYPLAYKLDRNPYDKAVGLNLQKRSY